MDIKSEISQKLEEIVRDLTKSDISAKGGSTFGGKIQLATPQDLSHGDFSSNIALQLAKELGKSPMIIAEEIVSIWKNKENAKEVSNIEAVAPGFINFTLATDYLVTHLEEILAHPDKRVFTDKLHNQKIMVEYAHPNTHKEAHIGHTRTLMTGESIARILEANGATVFRANYQGDVGPHVAKAVYGIAKTIEEEGKTLDEYEKLNKFDKIHFVAMSYARGNTDYEAHKEEIDNINKLIYKKGEGNNKLWDIYQKTRQWSLEYYEDLYQLFGVKFDRLFFETEMAEEGPRIVRDYIGKVFVQDPDGSVYFPGEEYGLHTRVFITRAGTPTYEGKEMANAMLEAKTFPFDKKIHVVGSEQEGYFQVVFKALELINPAQFVGKQVHLPTGIIQLKGRKMSSRTGDVLTYNQLIDEVKESVGKLFANRDVAEEEREITKEQVALGAIKYSVLKGGTRQNVLFDMEKSISLQGDSGPYIQYTYARTQSVLLKSQIPSASWRTKSQKEDNQIEKGSFILSSDYAPNEEEMMLSRLLTTFPQIVQKAADDLSPNRIADFLYELAKNYNLFYQKYRIVNAPSQLEKDFRLALTKAAGIILRQGLGLLGIEAPEKM